MKKVLYITIACILSIISANAQEINGRIVNETGQPLEFVNIIVLKTADSTFVQGTTSRNDGSFTLTKPNVQSFVKNIIYRLLDKSTSYKIRYGRNPVGRKYCPLGRDCR